MRNLTPVFFHALNYITGHTIEQLKNPFPLTPRIITPYFTKKPLTGRSSCQHPLIFMVQIMRGSPRGISAAFFKYFYSQNKYLCYSYWIVSVAAEKDNPKVLFY